MRVKPSYIPTPEQIAQACFAIRERWSPAEKRRRLVGCPKAPQAESWLPPRIELSRTLSRVHKELSVTA